MKRKKLMATAVASALVAAQMVMPVAAATGSGSVDVDVQNTDTVLRVQVPTDLVVAVDEYEIAKDGSQISSAAFEMVNKSAVPVSVAVTSTATVTGVALSATNEVDNTADEMWLAVAAQTAKNEYGVEKIGDLTSKSANVATFDGTSKTAAQTFYLAEATGNVVYNFVDVTTAGDVGEGNSFGEYHALTAITLSTGNEQSDLNTQIAAGDVYEVAQADSAVTKIEKGSSATYSTTSDYYTAAASTTGLTNIAVGKYIYAEMSTAAAAGGEAAFRYIGKLSTHKQNWSSTDFSKIAIAYTITGLNSSVYADAVADQSVRYGLYTAPVAPSVPGYTAGTPIAKTVAADTEIRIPVNLGVGSLGYKSIKVLWKENGTDLVAAKIVTLEPGTTPAMVITASAVNKLLEQDDAAAAGSKLLPLTMEVYFNGNTTADAVITLSK